LQNLRIKEKVMRRIDDLFTAWPFLGSRRTTTMLGWRATPAIASAFAGHCGARPEAAHQQTGILANEFFPDSAAPSLV
jgi:hypothetical protein